MRVIQEFEDIFVANPEYFSFAGKEVDLKQLLDFPILMLSQKSTTSEYLHQIFMAQGLRLIPEVELNSNDLLLDLARIGLGIACVPDYTLKTPLPLRQIVLVQHDTLPLSPAAKRFMSTFLENQETAP